MIFNKGHSIKVHLCVEIIEVLFSQCTKKESVHDVTGDV